MKIIDPITYEELDTYCFVFDTSESFICNEEKAIQDIMRFKQLDRNEAICLLQNSDADECVRVNDCEYWCE